MVLIMVRIVPVVLMMGENSGSDDGVMVRIVVLMMVGIVIMICNSNGMLRW